MRGLEVAWVHRSGDFHDGGNFIDGNNYPAEPLQTALQVTPLTTRAYFVYRMGAPMAISVPPFSTNVIRLSEVGASTQ